VGVSGTSPLSETPPLVLHTVLTVGHLTDANNGHLQIGERHDKTTVPLDFVDGFNLDDKRFEWSATSGNTFERRVIDDGDN
jgi:hypothetical protein